ncbi:hypothetical protein BRADI_5g01725v3, partial [Brachypodium distachyon]
HATSSFFHFPPNLRVPRTLTNGRKETPAPTNAFAFPSPPSRSPDNSALDGLPQPWRRGACPLVPPLLPSPGRSPLPLLPLPSRPPHASPSPAPDLVWRWRKRPGSIAVATGEGILQAARRPARGGDAGREYVLQSSA